MDVACACLHSLSLSLYLVGFGYSTSTVQYVTVGTRSVRTHSGSQSVTQTYSTYVHSTVVDEMAFSPSSHARKGEGPSALALNPLTTISREMC